MTRLSAPIRLLRRERSCVLLALGLAACAGGEEPSGGLEPPPPKGSLAVQVSGLPGETAAAVDVTGPGGFVRHVTASETLTGLTPGGYTVVAANVQAAGHAWAPNPPAQPAYVAANAVANAAVEYVVITGAIQVTVAGLPDGVEAGLALSGPAGFTAAVHTSQTLTGLAPGPYTITGSAVTLGTAQYAPTLPGGPVVLTPGLTPVGIVVSFARQTGAIAVQVSGLPPGAAAALAVTGPGGFTAGPTATQTLSDLDPGAYALAASPVIHAGHTWAPTPGALQLNVTAGQTVAAPVHYAIVTGGLTVSVTGLPTGTAAGLSVTGPGGFAQWPTETTAYTGLQPGTYTIVAASVSAGGQTWNPVPASQQVAVTAGTTPALAAVAYVPATGALTLTVSGLPGGVAASVSATGPAGFSQQVTASTTLSGLAPGTYTIAAANVSSGGTTYVPAPGSQGVTVAAGATAAAAVAYTGAPAVSLNLTIDGLHFTQATQRYDGSVPLVAGRDAFLRVFVLANEPNAAMPAVRVRLYHGAALAQTYTLNPPAASVPLSVNQGSLSASWNLQVPGGMVTSDLRVLADVDPAGAVPEANENDNTFPAGGAPVAVDVRGLPPFALRFVPVLQQVNGLQGDVTSGNQEQYLADVRKLIPIGAYDADLRAVYTTTAPALQGDNANGAWGTILSEVLALKAADASTRYYYGVVKTSYSSGVAGIGYVGGGARTALGWDRLPSGSGVMAHELGHNMGRLHAPCGGAGGPDPGYPHAGGVIGVWGLDLATFTLKHPTTQFDLMGYCSPDWVSDYNWSAMVAFREAGPNNVVAWDAARGQSGGGRGLLVWGRVSPDGPVLEPALAVDRGAALPAPGPHRVVALAADGSELFRVSFAAREAVDLPSGREEAFAFVVPAPLALRGEIAELRLVANGRAAVQRPRAGPPPGPDVTRDGAGRTVLRWDASAWPMVLVRDPATGQILSFARGGEVRLARAWDRLDLTFSDGTRSRRERR